MKELNQEQHIQLLQFMSLMQTCKTEAELEKLKEQYFNIPRYEFLQEYISEKNEKQSFSSYKTSLIYDMDKYQQDYKFVYGENFPAYKKESMPNNKADYTVLNLLNEISECYDILAYQKLLNEKNKFPKVKIENLSSDFTGIFFSNGLPVSMILNSPEFNFNARRQLVEAGYSPFTLPSVEDVKENGFGWLHEEISHFKETLNPNFIKMETLKNQEVELNEKEYEEDVEDFVEQMDANAGMSSMVAEDDYNASFEEYEDVDEVQRQMDIDNGLIDENGNTHYQKIEEEELEQWYETVDWEDPMESAEAWQNGTQEQIAYIRKRQKEKIIENKKNQESELNIGENGNEIMFDNSKSETENRKSIKAIDIWNEIYETIAENPEYKAIKFWTLDYLYNKGTDDAAGYDNSFERNIHRLEEIGKSDKQLQLILEKYKYFKIDFDDEALAVKIAGATNNNFNKAKQNLLDFVESKKYLRESEISQNFSDISQEEFEKYIHSEEFILKFGDWEKASRLQKLSEAPTIVKNGKVIIEGEDITEKVNNFRNDKDNKVLRIFAKDIGRSVKGTYHNDDLDIDVVLSMGNIDEIKNHHMAMSGHLEAIQYIPDIIKQGIYIAEEANEDKTKHPNIEKYKYFVSALKIDGVDYTCKSAIGVDKDGNHYYDQRLSQIEKGLLLDNLSQLMSRGKSEQSLLDYDKRLLRICQCPQTLYLDKELKPTKDAVKSVMAGKLYLEKDKNGFQLLHDIDKNKIIGKELSEMIEKNMLDTVDSENDIQNVSDLSQEDFEKYIHSEEFISKFGDWEKVNRLEKLKESEPLIGSDSIIVEGVDVSDIASRLRASYSIENLKQLQNIARDAGREVIAKLREEQNVKSPNPPVLINTDSGKEFKVQMTGINEIKNHNIFSKGHIEAISAIPELIKNAIYISSEPNEDGRKPQYTKFHYFAYGYNLDNEDYTAKIVFTETKEGELFYDQSLSAIEKGLLIDIIQKKNMLETFNQKNIQNSSEQDEVLNPLISQENLDNYDKRLVSICQVPQMPYLERNVVTRKWQPSKEAVEAVKNGTLYIEKQGQKYVMNESANNKIEKKDFSEIIDNNIENLQYVNESVNTEFSDNDIPVENNEIVEESETQYEMQNYKNNNTNISAPRPRNVQELHHFFINNPYVSGTPVPTLAMRNEQTGHSTFIEGYEFARFEDIGKPNPSFKDVNGKQIKPDGQTVVLTKPGFKEEIDKETGEKKLVPDERKRKFIKISRELYEQAIKNSEIIAKRTPKNEQERQKMIDDYKEAANLDEKEQRVNTASNFWHNYQAGVMTLANNKQEAMAFAKRLVNEMIPAEREKFATMVKKYEKLRGSDGKHLSYDQRIIDFYDNIGLKITSNSIWRDHVDDKYNTLDAIKKNTEVFDKEGQPLDKTCRMKIGDTIKMSVAVDSVLSNKKIKLPIQEYRLVAHSKDNNSVALISADGRQKIIKNREDFIKEVQKVEKKLMKKQQRQDKYESISM